MTPFILLAIAIHAVLLFLLSNPHGKPYKRNDVLEIYLQPKNVFEMNNQSRSYDDSNKRMKKIVTSEHTAKSASRLERMDSAQMLGDQTEISLAPDPQKIKGVLDIEKKIETALPIESKGIQNLLDSAHQIAKEAGKEYQESKESLPTLSDRPIVPELAKMLEKKSVVAGVTEYADGVIRVVTASGEAYCMQSRSNFPQDGPVEALSIPMFCP